MLSILTLIKLKNIDAYKQLNSLSSTIYTFIFLSNTFLFLFPYLALFCFYFPI